MSDGGRRAFILDGLQAGALDRDPMCLHFRSVEYAKLDVTEPQLYYIIGLQDVCVLSRVSCCLRVVRNV